MKKLEIVEAEYENKPTYLIKLGQKFLWKIVDGVTTWTNRGEFAWHNPDKKEVESVLEKLEFEQLKNSSL